MDDKGQSDYLAVLLTIFRGQKSVMSALSARTWSRIARYVFLVCSLTAAAVGPGLLLARNYDHGGRRSGGPIVNTLDGPVRGLTKNGVNMFLGIPYAAPPVGEFRWQPPQPVKRWRGTLNATGYGSNCPQVTGLGAFAAPTSIDEDCLYLNVFTTGSSHHQQKKPIIVWIHGGGNIDGEANDYDGSKLATGGPNGVETVVVTFNYRLGLFGTFSHPAINAEGHLWGNYAALDQQAALRWVQRNIGAFGGEPDKVAVGGQSQGAIYVGVNVLSPLSEGLFSRAILESSPAGIWTSATAATALNIGTNFAIAAGCPGSGVDAAVCLRNLSAARILQLQGTPNATGPYTGGPFVDGNIIPLEPDQAWTTGHFNKMPILGGGTKDERAFITGIAEYFSGPPQMPMTADQYAQAIVADAHCDGCPAGKMPAGVATHYPISDYDGNPMIAYERIPTDASRCAELRVLQKLAAQVSTYAYDFTYENAPYYFPKMPGYKPLAAHTIDIQFLFNNFHGGQLGVNLDQATGQPRELNAMETKLSDQMVAAWTNFANTGNPNGSGNSPWPKLTTDDAGQYFVEDIPLSTKSVSRFRTDYKCDFWDRQ
jgi:para-nitrobenzyl esterase